MSSVRRCKIYHISVCNNHGIFSKVLSNSAFGVTELLHSKAVSHMGTKLRFRFSKLSLMFVGLKRRGVRSLLSFDFYITTSDRSDIIFLLRIRIQVKAV